MTIQKKIWLLCLIGAVYLLAALPALAQDTWYVLTIGGQPVGSLHEEVVSTEGTVRVTSKAHLILNRMGSKVEMEMGEVSRESPAGRLLGADVDLRVSTQATSSHITVEGGAVRIRDQAGDRSFERTVPYTGELLGPEGIRKLSAARLAKTGDRIEVQTWAADLGGVRKVTRTAAAEETLTLAGAPVRTLRVEEVTEGNPAKRLLWLDAAGRLVQSADPGPFGEMRSVRADEAAARQTDGGGELPAEAYGSSLVHTQVRIPHARRVERVVLRLRHREPSLGWPDFGGPGLRVLDKTAEKLTLEITRLHPETVQPFPVPAVGDERAFLEPSAYVQSDDREIRAAAKAVVAGESDAYQAGQKLQRWVTKNMQFDLGIVFAPSTEVFQNRRGTCAGYAMLLTTMSRAVGIPARYVMGYVYLDGIFGGHAWTEIKVGKDWIPLDAAVPAPAGTPADATHIPLLRTSLAEGIAGLGAGPALQMFGHLDIDILSVTVAGRPEWTVPAGARLYTVEGDVYRNTGLGIELTKPSGFRFVGLDDVWPESRLVGMEGPDGEKVTLEREDADRGETPAESAGKATRVFKDGEDLWLLTAAGKDAPGLLRRIAATVKLPD